MTNENSKPAPTVPKPETRRALLISAGVLRPTTTVHHYYETRACVLPGPGGGNAYEHIFKCFKTGAERRWGTVRSFDDELLESEGN